MSSLCKVIRWGYRGANKKGHQVAKVMIYLDGQDELDTGQISLLKIELRDSFPQAKDRDINILKTWGNDWFEDGTPYMEWSTPRPGISIYRDHKGWANSGKRKLRKDFDWVVANPIRSIVELFQWIKVTLL